MFLSFDQVIGNSRSLEALFPLGPRQLGQFSAWTPTENNKNAENKPPTIILQGFTPTVREEIMDPKLTADSERQNPKLGRIRIYPFKSLAPIEVTECRLTDAGSLENDRRFAFMLANGDFFNAKRTPQIHQIHLKMNKDLTCFEFSRRTNSERITVNLNRGFEALEQWMLEQFQVSVKVCESNVLGYPDDTESPGPTIISKATLERITSWFPALNVDDVRMRLRANLEIENVPPFWEDRLFGAKEKKERIFSIGETSFQGVNPCQRCIVPSRDPQTGVVIANFAKHFQAHRKSELPDWSDRKKFNHFYRIATNTRLAENTQATRIRVGDYVRL